MLAEIQAVANNSDNDRDGGRDWDCASYTELRFQTAISDHNDKTNVLLHRCHVSQKIWVHKGKE